MLSKERERKKDRKNSADKFQAGVIGVRRGASPLSSHNLTLTITPATLHSSPTPLHPPLPETHFSQGALNSLALFDLGRSGVSVRYKPTVNHE